MIEMEGDKRGKPVERKKCPMGSFPYTIKSGDTFYFLAQRYNTTVEEIMKLNPGVDPKNLQIGQVVCIPTEKKPTPPPKPDCPHGFYYTIKSGDTIYLLSQQFGVGVDDILYANPGIDPYNLQIGQVICIPKKTPHPGPGPEPHCSGVYYRVKPGDTLYLLSQKFCVSVQELMKANPGIDPNYLMVGQVLCIPLKCKIFCE